MPSKDVNVPGFKVKRARLSMTRAKRGSGKLACDLNNTDGDAPSYKRPIPEKKVVVTQEMMDAERARLLGEKQALLANVTTKHDTLVCYSVSSFVCQFSLHIIL